MTKQPFLTGFPRTALATARHRLQAALRGQRSAILRHSICGYTLVFSRFLPGAFLEGIDPTARQRHFGHVPVFWAWLAQILEANASCSKAVSLNQARSRANGRSVPSGDTGGYCPARRRIDPEFLAGVHSRILRGPDAGIRPSDLWHGHVLKAIDGSSVQLVDTAANQRAYPQPGGQKPVCGFPTMGIVGVLNLCHGGREGFVTCPHTAHDSPIALRLLGHVGEGDVLLGDRTFCTYGLIALLREKGAHAFMRLHQARHAKLDWRKGKRVSAIERVVVWKKPRLQPAGSTLDAEAWRGLPEELVLRYIKLGYEDRCGMKRMLVLVTTLLDDVKYDALGVASLYAQRWAIELKLRDVKTILGMERFDVRAPDMACRSLWMMTIANNLLRGLMQGAAIVVGKPIAHMSFKGILDHAVASHEGYLVHRGRPRRLAAHHTSVMEVCAGKLIDIRPFRREPQAIKQRPKGFPLLTKHRKICQEIPHRGRPRSAA